MTTLLPTLYAAKNRSTFFDVRGTLVTVAYELIDQKRLFLFPAPSLARIEINIGDGVKQLTHEYSVPRDRQVGPEIGAVERGLYELLADAVRTIMQIKVLELAEKEVEALEAEHLFEGGSADRDDRWPANEAAARRAHEQRILSEVVDRLITAVRHVTNVTSLDPKGLEDHLRDRSEALEKVLHSAKLTSVLEAQGVLGAVETFLAHEVEETTDVSALRSRTLDYLQQVQEASGDVVPAISYQQAHIIANEFVPAFVEMKKEYDESAAVPSNIVEHAFGSFFGGGIAGYLTLSLLGESVIRGLTGMSVDLPGWYIGAAAAFVWPYLMAALGFSRREKRYEKQRQRLRDRLTRRLGLVWPEGGKPQLPAS